MNRDTLKRFPDQDLEKRPTECQSEIVADLVGNLHDTPCDPGFTFANTLRLEGIQPTTGIVASPLAAMQSAVVWGCLPTESEPFDATTTSELYEANWKNYPKDSYTLARNFAMRGVLSLYTYQDIVSYLNSNPAGVALSINWYQNFNTPLADGRLPFPAGPSSPHTVAVYDNPLKGLQIKPLRGPHYGDGGYSYMSQTIFNEVFLQAQAFDLRPNASRWWSLASIGFAHPSIIRTEIIPQLATTS